MNVTASELDVILFDDVNVKKICVSLWDKDGNGELTKGEVAAVESLGSAFMEQTDIVSFDELKYFTGLRTIGSETFYGCSSLVSIIIPQAVTSIGNRAFSNCTGLVSITFPCSVKHIGDYAFDCTALTDVTMPDSLETIGDYAFYYSMLTNITIPKSVRQIGSYAFCCPDLTKITIDEANPVYDSRDSCNAIIESSTNKLICACNSSTIPNTVESIAGKAFSCCHKLKSVVIPRSVTHIGENAFTGCSSINSIAVDERNLVYDSRQDCNAIIKTSTNTIIRGCSTTIIPRSVTAIGEDAFRNSYDLSNIVIPSSVKSIGKRAFANCTSLSSVNIPCSVSNIDDYAFVWCSSLKSVTIPNSVTNIGIKSFSNCTSLKIIVIPNSVTTIRDHAFYCCTSLIFAILPASITHMGNEVFRHCKSLSSVSVGWQQPSTIPSVNTFPNREKATLYVPVGSKASYAYADYWKDFKEIIEMPENTSDSNFSIWFNTIFVTK